MDWTLNKDQITEVVAMFTELCEKIAGEKISFNLSIRRSMEGDKVLFTYDVHAIAKDKLIYIKMGNYRSLMDEDVTNEEPEKIIELLKGDK